MDDDPAPAAAGSAGRLRRPPLEVRVSSTVGRLPLSRERIATLAGRVLRGERAGAAMLTITVVGDREMARLNKRHLGHRGTTDIITFQHARTVAGAPVVGDIYISASVARRNATEAGCTWREEMARLTVHGVLHALGWDHPDGNERLLAPMWARQERWVARLERDGAW